MTRAPLFADTAFYVAAVMAAFAILFGTRHTDATEHHEGLIQAVAFESLVKLVAFLALGTYVTWGMFDGLGDLLAGPRSQLELQRQLAEQDFGQASGPRPCWPCWRCSACPASSTWPWSRTPTATMPGKARWLFPLYLVAFAFFVCRSPRPA